MTLLKINTPIGYKAAVYHPQLGIAHIVKGKLIVGATANKKKDFTAGDSFAKTFGDTPHYCESVGNEPAIIFVGYAGVEEEPVTIPFKNKVIISYGLCKILDRKKL